MAATDWAGLHVLQVANKAIELLMFNEGQEVCCTNESDARRLETLGTAKLRQAEAENESA